MQGNFCFGQTDTLVIDSKASQVAFTIKHLGVLNVDGKFGRFDGSITFKKGKPQYIESIIDVASIGTNDSVRDRTIVSEGYLDAESFPLISFVSKAISENTIIGVLRIKNVEKQIEMLYSIDENSFLIISTTLSRAKFKLDFGAMNGLIGDKISVNLKLKPFFKL